MQVPRDQLLAQLAQLDRRYAELERQLADQAGSRTDPRTYQAFAKELSELRDLVLAYRTYLRVGRDAEEAELLSHAQGDLDVQRLPAEIAEQQGDGIHLVVDDE